MLSETEIRNMRQVEMERLEALVDPEDRIRQRIVIGQLDLVLDE